MTVEAGMTVRISAKRFQTVELYDSTEQACEAARGCGASAPAGTMRMPKGDSDTAVVLVKAQSGYKRWTLALRTDAYGPCVVRDVNSSEMAFFYTAGRLVELAP